MFLSITQDKNESWKGKKEKKINLNMVKDYCLSDYADGDPPASVHQP